MANRTGTRQRPRASLHVVEAPVAELRPWPRNPRRITPARLEQLQAMLTASPEMLQARPLIALPDGTVIAGNQRLAAVTAMGWETVPVVYADLDEQMATRWAFADNNPLGESDDDLAAQLLAELEASEVDLLLTGFAPDETARLLASLRRSDADPDAAPEPPSVPRSVRGEVYELGSHRLMCGDATSAEDVAALLDGGVPDVVLADPPYGINVVPKSGKIGASKLAKVGTYRPIAGDESSEVASAIVGAMLRLEPRAAIFWGAQHWAAAVPPSRCWLVWDKETGSNVFADCEIAWTSLDAPPRLFRHAWNGMLRASERGARRHPTQKPVALAEWCLEIARAGENILDPCIGAGWSLIAAERTGRRCYGVEIDPAYCDVIRQRYADYTGDQSYAP